MRTPSPAGNSAARQPICVASQALNGRKASWPVALLAESSPTSKPRLLTNQRLATVAANTIAVRPVATPTTSPQSTIICQNSRMKVAPASARQMRSAEVTATLRKP